MSRKVSAVEFPQKQAKPPNEELEERETKPVFHLIHNKSGFPLGDTDIDLKLDYEGQEK